MNIHDFKIRKTHQQKISVITCYDYLSAQIVAQTSIDAILVGDSLAMVVHGHPTTLHATIDMMALHVSAVARGAGDTFIIGDLPFCAYRKTRAQTITAAETLMRAGAHAVKLEGAVGNLNHIEHLVTSGIPVIGHLGLTPQSIHTLGGCRVQGKTASHAQAILSQAQQLEAAGCCALVLECIPQDVAKNVTHALAIPTIGIGAGPHTDGQVLVWHDMLGLNPDFTPKFLKIYANGFSDFQTALRTYDREVKENAFPNPKQHSF